MTRTSTKRRVAIRQAINQQLGQQDAISRCRFCRRQLPAGYLLLLTPSGGTLRYCDQDCREDDVCASQARSGH